MAKTRAFTELIDNLYSALGTANRPCRDECGDWSIFGDKGKIYTDGHYGPNWYLFTGGESWPNSYRWDFSKNTLSFMKVLQNGDHEGVLSLNRMPTSSEAQQIRKIAGIRKKKQLTAEHRTKLVESGKNFRFFYGSTDNETAPPIA